MPNNIMPSTNLVSYLRDARLAKHWSQRDLSERAGMPQAHISRIESGAVDPKTSTLQQLARLLDLELTLVPRSALTAVDAVVREASGDADRREFREFLRRMHQAASNLQAMAGGLGDRVADAADDLAKLDPAAAPPWVRTKLLAAVHVVDKAVQARNPQALEVALEGLRPILNDALRLAQGARPAYTLDDEA